jgi:hypothetical protein
MTVFTNPLFANYFLIDIHYTSSSNLVSSSTISQTSPVSTTPSSSSLGGGNISYLFSTNTATEFQLWEKRIQVSGISKIVVAYEPESQYVVSFMRIDEE